MLVESVDELPGETDEAAVVFGVVEVAETREDVVVTVTDELVSVTDCVVAVTRVVVAVFPVVLSGAVSVVVPSPPEEGVIVVDIAV